MPVEDTMDYLGLALATNGTPLADRPVTLKRSDTLATLASTVTDANGLWRFDDISPANIVRAEISAGTTPQIAVKSVFSGDAYSLYIREKLTAAPAAIVNLPPVANIFANSVLLTTALQPALDARYLNVSGDSIITLTAETVTTASLITSSAADIGGALDVGGAATFNAPVTMLSTLDVLGNIVGQAGVQAPGIGSFGGGLDVAGGEFQIDSSGNLHHYNGAASFEGTSTFAIPNAAVTIGGTLGVAGATTLAGTLGVTGATTLAGTLLVQNQIRVGATAMSAASSVTNVVRKIEIRDAAGAAVGWVPVYSAAG